jgi:hypothetical protein
MKKTEMMDKDSRSECRAKMVSEEEIKMEEIVQTVMLESAKIDVDPSYWPIQWRKHIMALGSSIVALISRMEDRPKDEAKELEFARRISRPFDKVDKVFREMEHFMYDLWFDQERNSKKGVSEEPDALPVDYWPGQWRKHVRALTISILALAGQMADEAKARKFALRAIRVLDELAKVLPEVDDFLFDPEEDSCANC